MDCFIGNLKDAGVYSGYPPFEERAIIPITLYHHPEYVEGLKKNRAVVDDGTKCFHGKGFAPSYLGEYERDLHGRPLHPYHREIREAGLAVYGPGAYWHYGPNLSAIAMLMGISSGGRLKAVLFERDSDGLVALPTGYRDANESPELTALRELRESAGLRLCPNDITCMRTVHEGIATHDPKTTMNAWGEIAVVLFALAPGAIDRYEPRSTNDARKALLAVVDDDLYANTYVAHRDLLCCAMQEFMEHSVVALDTDGFAYSCR